MATIVCHGLPSTLDSHLVESRIHNLRLNSPIDLPFNTCSNTISNEDSWSSIQSLSKSTYVHPNVKLPWHKLSSKSLELCTENLGNETGADILESNIDFFSLTTSPSDTKQQKRNSSDKVRTKSFPPPLKSMRGLHSLRAKPHRENGRLVIELTKVPSSVSCFQAERSNGRLRLSFWKDVDEDYADEEDEEEEKSNQVEECFIDKENKVNEGKECIIDNEEVNDEVECMIDNEKEEGDIYEVPTPTQIREARMEKYERESRRRRCKEIGKHENNEMLVNWGEPVWLALVTS